MINDVQSPDGERILEYLVKASVIGTIVVNKEGIIEMMNVAALKMFGYQTDTMIGNNLEALIPTKNRGAHENHLHRFFSTPSARSMSEKRLVYGRHQSGNQFPVEVVLTPVSINNRTLAIATVSDVTLQKKIKDRNTLLFQAFQETINGIYLIDVKSLQFTDINQGGLTQLGYTLQEIKAQQPWDLGFAEDEQQFKTLIAPLQRQINQKLNFEAVLKRKDQTQLTADVHLQRFIHDHADLYIIFAIDVSERRQAEEALVLQSEITRNLAEGVILLKAEDGRILYANIQFDNMFNLEQDEIYGQNFFDFCTCSEAPVKHLLEEISQQITRERKWVKELLCPRKDQPQFWCRISLTAFEHPQHVSVWLGVFSNIDTSKRVELALAREQEKARMYLDVAASMFVVIDKDRKVSLINQQGCKLLGYPEEEIIGRDWFDSFLPNSTREEVELVFKEAMKGEIQKVEYQENLVLTRDGQERLIEWHNALLRDEHGQVVASLSSGIDITEKRRASQLRTQALIEGQETERRRIAEELHDGLSQSLTAIRLHLGALEADINKERDEKYEKLQVLKNMIEDVTQEVKVISKALKPKVLEEYGLLKSLELLTGAVNESSALEINLNFYEYFKEPAYNIRLCIYRVVQELIHNVIKHASASRLDIQIVKHRDRIVLTVEDDGAGFDMQYQKTNGNGLGLRNIETRVSSLSGTVEIDSAPGKGTLIIVEIPLNQP
jgi:PAS domain S-box-containing protein